MGYTVVAVSDVNTGLYNEKGLNIAEIVKYAEANGTIKGYSEKGSREISNEELLTLDVDILVPAAMENQITGELAPKVRAKVIVEAANGPTTAEADKILSEKKVILVPDILANAGGVVVSYFEWVQNLQAIFWDVHEINSMLKKIIIRGFDDVYTLSQKSDVTLRIAAYMVALERVTRASKIRGLFP
jgi:glutamate dehydrogenase (NAD(P)+)